MAMPYLSPGGQTGPASSTVAVTKSDTVADPAGPFRGFLIDGSSGAIKFSDMGGNAVTLANCAVGVIYQLSLSRVWSTGTTATNIYGLK